MVRDLHGMETGRFAFEGTDRYPNYVSEYHQNIGKKSAKIAAAKAAAADSDNDTTSEAV
ncbi:MAG: hypothetical protein JXR76_18620 [Deltaproteobacteria bacterium]|nr:hypothetical protein [Deltaproteobacteria bacterium]